MSHRKLLLASVAALGLSIGSATAADVYVPDVPAPMPEAAPQFDWSGPYLGLHGGAGWSNADSAYNNPFFNPPTCGIAFGWGCPVDVDPAGAFVGVQAGWNFIFGNGLMLGVEGDWSYASLSDSGDGPFAGGAFSTHIDLEVDQMATIQARIGWTMGRWLPFATVGWGWAHAERSAFNPVFLGPVAVSDTNWHDGLTLGAGVEYAINDRWSIKGEYRFFNGGTETYGLGFAGGTAIDLDIHTARFGVNFRF